MSVSVQVRGSKAQLRVVHRQLARPFFRTFDSAADAEGYGQALHALLDQGIVPPELLAPAERAGAADPLLVEVISAYTRAAPITPSDDALLGLMRSEVVGLRVSGVTYLWAESYVQRLKSAAHHLAPGTIRKRVGVLGRVLDWHLRRTAEAGGPLASNPLRLLPRGYSLYSAADAAALEPAQLASKRDVMRDRRLTAAEEGRIVAALSGSKRPDRERALPADPSFLMLYRLIVDTGLRLREAYRLRVDQVDLERRVIHVEGTKGHRGAPKPRTVPIRAALLEHLRDYCRHRVGLLFPYWDGRPESLQRTTTKLSQRFRVLFDYAQVQDVTEHDLRHEATCRWVELRRPGGTWVFSDVEICRLMGWTSPAMMLRYASLRGEDLAERLAGL